MLRSWPALVLLGACSPRDEVVYRVEHDGEVVDGGSGEDLVEVECLGYGTYLEYLRSDLPGDEGFVQVWVDENDSAYIAATHSLWPGPYLFLEACEVDLEGGAASCEAGTFANGSTTLDAADAVSFSATWSCPKE